MDTAGQGEVRMNWESSIEIYTLLYVKQRANGELLCNTGSSTLCSVTTKKDGMGWEMGVRFKREGTYVYLWLIHIDVWQKPTQQCKAIPSIKKKKKKMCAWLYIHLCQDLIYTALPLPFWEVSQSFLNDCLLGYDSQIKFSISFSDDYWLIFCQHWKQSQT